MSTAEREGALPYDVPGAELGHQDGGSSFESFIRHYNLTDPALLELAKIVRAADTSDRDAAPEGEGLRQIAQGWHLLDWSLERRLEVGFGVYDCLYAVCKERVNGRNARKILFLCPHHAAKSVIAAAYFNRIAGERGLDIVANSAGTDPDDKVSPVVVSMLAEEGIDVSHHIPRRVRTGELQKAERIISMDCTPEELGIAPDRVELWLDVPKVSEQPDNAREVIRRHVEALIAEVTSS